MGAPARPSRLPENIPSVRQVAVVLDDLRTGGAQRVALDLAAAREGGAWQVDLVSLELTPARPFSLRLPRGVVLHRPGLRGLPAWLHRHAPTVVHAHGARSALAVAMAAPNAGRPVTVATLHHEIEHEPEGSSSHRLPRSVYHRFDALLAVSESVRDSLLAYDDSLSGRVHVVPNGIELDAFADVRGMRESARWLLGYPEHAFVVGSVARLERCKGIDRLVEAAAQARAHVPGLELLVVGEGSERAALEARAESSGLGEHVRFVGEYADVRPYLAAFDLFAAPSRCEGFGVAVLEALAAGVPVAGAPVGGLPSLLAQGAAGWLVEGEVEAWAEALRIAASEPAERARFAAAGERQAARYSIARLCEALDTVYRGAMDDVARAA